MALRAASEPVALHMPPETPASITRRLKGVPAEGLILLRTALAREAEAERLRKTLERFVDEWRKIKLEVTGEDLKALGYRPGPAMGEALRAALDAKINGELPDRAAELAFIRRLLDNPPGR
jgi:tRNA nucleotidyltransferase (CCA-adding enzyme)